MTNTETPYPVFRQIADYFENRIADGLLKENDRLPSTQELTRQFKASSRTIQLSLNLLAERGLIERSPKRGTFVRRGLGGKTMGIVFGCGLFSRPEHIYQRYILEQMICLAIAGGWKYELYPISENLQYDIVFHRLKNAVSSGELRAVMEHCAPQEAVDFLAECPVPLISDSYEIDWCEMASSGVKYLKEYGAERIAVFDIQMLMDFADDDAALKKTIRDLRKQYDIPIKLIQIPRNDVANAGKIYRIAELELKKKERPDSILVLKDILLTGILFSAYERGLKIPDDLHLLSHVNKGLPLFTPFALTSLVLDPDMMARTIMKDLVATVDGKEHQKKIPMKFILKRGISCGEDL